MSCRRKAIGSGYSGCSVSPRELLVRRIDLPDRVAELSQDVGEAHVPFECLPVRQRGHLPQERRVIAVDQPLRGDHRQVAVRDDPAV